MNKTKLKTEQIRQQYAKKYKDQIADKDTLIKKLQEENKTLSVKNKELSEQVRLLEEAIRLDAEWLERMQDYVNMTPEEMDQVRASLQSSKESRQALAHMSELFNVFDRTLGPGLNIMNLLFRGKQED